jgi:TetR/AcrR family transcriptional regulator, cholesterol catabolism regulator
VVDRERITFLIDIQEVAILRIVPSTKPHQDRAEKREELIGAARRLFIEDGFEATSMAHLARTAGVAPNTIYWYFEDKDAVLIAVLEAAVAEALAGYAEIVNEPLEHQVRWSVDQLMQLRKLISALHARLERSPALNAWHTTFHHNTEALLRAALQQHGATEQDLDAETRIWVFTVEGLLTHQLPDDEQDAICRQLVARATN